jgi:hypothetical protein
VLVSFQLASKYPDNLVALFNHLQQTADDPGCFEVLVKVDTEDEATSTILVEQAKIRPFSIRSLIIPRGEGYAGLWRGLNDLFSLTDPLTYFVCNINDEVRIRERGWDRRLSRYIGLFPDHIYRLRTSQLKFRNYYDFWESGYAPENYGFYTRRWLEITEGWSPCFGPDNSQQYIAYYMGLSSYPAFKQCNRDVPILDISWSGEGVGLNLSYEQQIIRTATNFRLWNIQVSHSMQEELYRRALLLRAHIVAAEMPDRKFSVATDTRAKLVELRDTNSGDLAELYSYKLSRVDMWLKNVRRTCRFTYYAGGGREAWNFLPFNVLEYFLHRYPPFRHALLRVQSSVLLLFRLPIIVLEYFSDFVAPLWHKLQKRTHRRKSVRRQIVTRFSELKAKIGALFRVFYSLRFLRRVSSLRYWLYMAKKWAWALRQRDLRWMHVDESARKLARGYKHDE